MFNGAITERAKIAGFAVGTVNTTPINGAAIDMALYDRVDFILMTGTLNSTETADFLVQTDTVSTFDDSAATLKSSTAEVVSDDECAIISIKSADLPDGDRYARAVATGSGATGGPCCLLAIGHPRATNYDDGSPNVVGEIDAIQERLFAA